jgi:ubiquinone/menaquinone biosynthesis C-methylase UbiE
MALTPEKAAQIDGFTDRYRNARADVIRQIETSVFGCDYGATSWTTREEAGHVIDLLGISPTKRLLEIGSGSGWPGLYLAKASGCDVVQIDLPFDGLKVAAERAREDDMADRWGGTVADGAALPFHNSTFDAVFHSDVLCCLESKMEALSECRRVLRDDGTLVFSVLLVTPDLSPEAHRHAISCGPPYIDAPSDYPTMLTQAGWRQTDHADLTEKFYSSVRDLFHQEEKNADELIGLFGETSYAERLASRRKRIEGLEAGLIKRELFRAVPST